MRIGLNKKLWGTLRGEWFWDERKNSSEGNCVPQANDQGCRRNGGVQEGGCATQSLIMQRSAREGLLGSNRKIIFTGAFSVELWEVHPESSGLGSE